VENFVRFADARVNLLAAAGKRGLVAPDGNVHYPLRERQLQSRFAKNADFPRILKNANLARLFYSQCHASYSPGIHASIDTKTLLSRHLAVTAVTDLGSVV
jgi:hypothetical protein